LLRLKVDSREQRPLQFKKEVFRGGIISEGLPFGDYWVDLMVDKQWLEIPIVFERKALGDLFGTMTQGYERFKEEMAKAALVQVQLILIIEGSMRDVYKGFKHSQYKGESMIKKLFMLWVRYDLFPVFCNDRREMSRFIEETFSAVERNYAKSPDKYGHPIKDKYRKKGRDYVQDRTGDD